MINSDIVRSLRAELSRFMRENAELCEEIAERKRAAESLREEGERFRALTELVGEWIFWRGPDGSMLYISPACERITGYAAEDFHMSPGLFETMIHPEDIGTWTSHAREADAQKEMAPIEFRIVTRRGDTRWIRHMCRPVRNSAGTFLGVEEINQDQTERKRLEEELQGARRLETIGLLAGGMAHDFNNLLTSILGNVSLALMSLPHDSRASGRLEEVEKASLRARDLTRQLLVLADGGIPARNEIPVASLIREAAADAVRGTDVRTEVDIPDGIPAIFADGSRISNVMYNIVSNAAAAMTDGGVVKVSAESETIAAGDGRPLREGTYVKIRVEDGGCGIPEENLLKIFEPFFTTKPMGNGLGLAVANSIVKRHGGHIAVESRQGVGTIFTVYMPACVPGDAGKSATVPAPASGKRKVLVMDDDEMLRAVILDILDALGYQGISTNDGAEAVEAYVRARGEGAPFDAVIMDLVVLNGMGGTEAVRRILDIDPSARAILSSGYSNDPAMADFRKYGFRGAIAKPYKVKELKDVLENVLRCAS